MRKPRLATAPTPSVEIFHREGDFWTVTFEDVTLHVRDGKGMRYLAHLLGRPNERIDVRRLSEAVPGANGAGAGETAGPDGPSHDREHDRVRSAVSKRIGAAIAHLHLRDPALGGFLKRAVHTGYSCAYETDPGRPVRWDVIST
jgi:hypothetical protein